MKRHWFGCARTALAVSLFGLWVLVLAGCNTRPNVLSEFGLDGHSFDHIGSRIVAFDDGGIGFAYGRYRCSSESFSEYVADRKFQPIEAYLVRIPSFSHYDDPWWCYVQPDRPESIRAYSKRLTCEGRTYEALMERRESDVYVFVKRADSRDDSGE